MAMAMARATSNPALRCEAIRRYHLGNETKLPPPPGVEGSMRGPRETEGRSAARQFQRGSSHLKQRLDHIHNLILRIEHRQRPPFIKGQTGMGNIESQHIADAQIIAG